MSSDDQRPTDATDPWAPAGSEAAPSVTGASSTAPRRRGLFITAMVIFSIGVIFTIIAAGTPLILGRDAPTILYLVAMLFTPTGFVLGLLYAILGSRPPKV
ncbi:hypothetical protein K3888_09950 [Dietzia aurantiaca]|uniref:hypothetical protein n=1 Tax=Dietzia aurantiaca TaxID=983873 RepID=UPI001E5B7289|nr:hypothetical protein [Dietzia aurantiaca]MCD2263024.1 hypothetical protein [Dietzia aurantiaca]